MGRWNILGGIVNHPRKLIFIKMLFSLSTLALFFAFYFTHDSWALQGNSEKILEKPNTEIDDKSPIDVSSKEPTSTMTATQMSSKKIEDLNHRKTPTTAESMWQLKLPFRLIKFQSKQQLGAMMASLVKTTTMRAGTQRLLQISKFYLKPRKLMVQLVAINSSLRIAQPIDVKNIKIKFNFFIQYLLSF